MLEAIEGQAGAVQLTGREPRVEDRLERGEPSWRRVAEPERVEALIDIRHERLAQSAVGDLELASRSHDPTVRRWALGLAEALCEPEVSRVEQFSVISRRGDRQDRRPRAYDRAVVAVGHADVDRPPCRIRRVVPGTRDETELDAEVVAPREALPQTARLGELDRTLGNRFRLVRMIGCETKRMIVHRLDSAFPRAVGDRELLQLAPRVGFAAAEREAQPEGGELEVTVAVRSRDRQRAVGVHARLVDRIASVRDRRPTANEQEARLGIVGLADLAQRLVGDSSRGHELHLQVQHPAQRRSRARDRGPVAC